MGRGVGERGCTEPGGRVVVKAKRMPSCTKGEGISQREREEEK